MQNCNILYTGGGGPQHAVFLAAISLISDWKIAFFLGPILKFMVILGIFICEFIICKPIFGVPLSHITRSTCTYKVPLSLTQTRTGEERYYKRERKSGRQKDNRKKKKEIKIFLVRGISNKFYRSWCWSFVVSQLIAE